MAEEQGILTDEEAAQERTEAAKEIFGDEGTADDDSPGTSRAQEPDDEPEGTDDATATETEPDPWDGVSPAIKEKFQQMESKLSDYDSVTARLKQAESRIGAITNEAAAKAKQDAEKLEAKDAPTQEEIDAAAESEAEWEDLKEEFPQWATAVDNRIRREGETFKKLQDRIDQLEQAKPATTANEGLEQEVTSLKQLVITIKHPDWRETVKKPEFIKFAESSDENRRLFASKDPSEAISLLDRYSDSASPKEKKTKTTAQIAEERKRRLRQSQTPNTGSGRQPAKSDDDMTDAEYRNRAAKKIFAEG